MDLPDDDAGSPQEEAKRLAESKYCLICSGIWKSMLDFYADLQYDLAHNEDRRRFYSEVGAVCSFHLWQLASMSSSVALSAALAESAQRASSWLRALKEADPGSGNHSKILFDSGQGCRICGHAERIERRRLDAMRRLLAAPEGRAAYEESGGFCLRHTVLLIGAMEAEHSDFIIGHAIESFSGLSQCLDNYRQKTKMIRRDLITPDESAAFSRALIHLGGVRYLRYPGR